MKNEKIILLLEDMIKSGKYDIDDLLENIPDFLLDELKEILKTDLKNTNEKDLVTKGH